MWGELGWLWLLMLSPDAAPSGTAVGNTRCVLSPFSFAGNVWGWPWEGGSSSPGAWWGSSSSMALEAGGAGSARAPGCPTLLEGSWRAGSVPGMLRHSTHTHTGLFSARNLPQVTCGVSWAPSTKAAEFPKDPTHGVRECPVPDQPELCSP